MADLRFTAETTRTPCCVSPTSADRDTDRRPGKQDPRRNIPRPSQRPGDGTHLRIRPPTFPADRSETENTDNRAYVTATSGQPSPWGLHAAVVPRHVLGWATDRGRTADGVVVDTITSGTLSGIELLFKVLGGGGDLGVADVCGHLAVLFSALGPGSCSTAPWGTMSVVIGRQSCIGSRVNRRCPAGLASRASAGFRTRHSCGAGLGA
jgi:hypothetical protein